MTIKLFIALSLFAIILFGSISYLRYKKTMNYMEDKTNEVIDGLSKAVKDISEDNREDD